MPINRYIDILLKLIIAAPKAELRSFLQYIPAKTILYTLKFNLLHGSVRCFYRNSKILTLRLRIYISCTSIRIVQSIVIIYVNKQL